MKVYGPYTGKDGRQRVILHENGKGNTVSYPKFLVETHIGRKLQFDETIDHIDGDFTNNDLTNLRIVNRSEHCSDDIVRRKYIEMVCVECGNVFLSDWKDRKRNKAGPFCRKSCSGKYGKKVQMGMEKLPPFQVKEEYHKLKDSKNIEPNIRNYISGLGDIGETLTDNADGNTEGTTEK